jgi:hypothetical protein
MKFSAFRVCDRNLEVSHVLCQYKIFTDEFNEFVKGGIVGMGKTLLSNNDTAPAGVCCLLQSVGY